MFFVYFLPFAHLPIVVVYDLWDLKPVTRLCSCGNESIQLEKLMLNCVFTCYGQAPEKITHDTEAKVLCPLKYGTIKGIHLLLYKSITNDITLK